MITPTTYWTATCTRCGMSMDEYEYPYASLVPPRAEADAIVDELSDGWAIVDGGLVCDDCVDYCHDGNAVPCEPVECGKHGATAVTIDSLVLTPHTDACVVSCDTGCGAILHRRDEDGELMLAYTTPEHYADPTAFSSMLSTDCDLAGWEYASDGSRYRCTRCRTSDTPAEWCEYHHLATDQCAHCLECLMCEAGYGIRSLDLPHQQHGFTRCPNCGTRTTVLKPGDPQQPALFEVTP